MSCYFGVLAGLAICEWLFPRRRRTTRRFYRWPANIGVAFVGTIIVRLLAPAGAFGLAIYAEGRGWGLFPIMPLPLWLRILASIVVLDLAIYLQHWLFHHQPLLWQLHRMHHTDLDVDVTTGARFHPVEIMLSFLIKGGVILGIGAPPMSVLVFEVLLNATPMFNHSNLSIPLRFEAWFRWLIVTPDMHRVHHSILGSETNSNFGFNLPIWDRLFRTYRAQPAAGHEGMTLGLSQFRDPKELRVDRMLAQPFRTDSSAGKPQPN
jgi:sterol desaturase/sphingolipid hydroxylase (fatty acid hydroxylase superfamily)